MLPYQPFDESGQSSGFETAPLRSARTQPPAIVIQCMANQAMANKLRNVEAIDVSEFDRDGAHYVLPFLAEGFDYCDAVTEKWIWSIGRRYADGMILASTTPSEFYGNPEFECIWLR